MTTTQNVKSRPILFSAPMVRAILEGRKTQTRRVVDRVAGFGPVTSFSVSDTQGYDFHFRCRRGLWQDLRRSKLLARCPYGEVGDRLWVRESFWNGTNCYTDASGEAVSYWTDKVQYAEERTEPGPWTEPYVNNVPWMLKRPSIHMPRKFSRITLEITNFRVERLCEISEEDAIAEGVTPTSPLYGDSGGFVHQGGIEAFSKLWESINGPGSWEANPWVWVVEFKRVESV